MATGLRIARFWHGLLLVLVAGDLHPRPAAAQGIEWSFDRTYDSDLVFVHARLNYAFAPDWLREWERTLGGWSSVRATVGSVTNRRFLTDVRVRINESLGQTRFRFHYDLLWLDGEHVDAERLEQFIGFEMGVAGPLGVQAVVNPASRKESVDLAVGLVLADTTRERYLHASLRLDDFLYDQKNEAGGRSVQEPVGIEWQGRWAAKQWEVFSEGRYQSASRRTFPDSARSPFLAGTERRQNGSTTRLRWLAGAEAYVEAQLFHYDLTEAETWRDGASSYEYRNRIVEGSVRTVFPLGARWHAWPGVSLLSQSSEATGRQEYDFSRTDVMPALFVAYAFSVSDALELGYMGSASDRQRAGADPSRDLDRSVWADKVQLGWTHEFAPAARIKMSVSHQVSAGRFGGGNVQFMATF